MTIKRLCGIAAAAMLLCAGPVRAEQGRSQQDVLARMMTGESQVQGAELNRRVAAAATHPLGSRENPVRAAMPEGQRAYLARLRCGDGQVPRFHRMGSYGAGIYGNIIDGYQVDCGAAAPGKVTVFMDMYHRGYAESRAAAGFTIVPMDSAPASPTV